MVPEEADRLGEKFDTCAGTLNVLRSYMKLKTI